MSDHDHDLDAIARALGFVTYEEGFSAYLDARERAYCRDCTGIGDYPLPSSRLTKNPSPAHAAATAPGICQLILVSKRVHRLFWFVNLSKIQRWGCRLLFVQGRDDTQASFA